MISRKLWLCSLPDYILEMLCTWGEKSIQNESIHFSGVRLLTGIALLYYSGEASDNLIIFMGTIHRGNGANNDTFNKVGGVSQWQNSPIKRTPHLLRYHLQFTWPAHPRQEQDFEFSNGMHCIYCNSDGQCLGCICLYKISIRSGLFLSGSSFEITTTTL